MKLVSFSVTNYRSIIKAHKIPVFGTTVLIGKNNQGKSNILKGLDVAMKILQFHGFEIKYSTDYDRRAKKNESFYYWERDFPISIQSRQGASQTIFRLEFLLNDEEIHEFKDKINSNLNGTLPIEIKIGKDNTPHIRVRKHGKGTKTLNSKSNQIAEFIAYRIFFNYIPAVRTDQEAIDVVRQMLSKELEKLETQQVYINALQTIRELQQPILNELSTKIQDPLIEFLPNIRKVKIDIIEEVRRSSLRNDFESAKRLY